MTYAVELKNITKEFVDRQQTTRAVDNINLSIEDGEFFALLGPSGCGKTTTLRMIAGFEYPTSGTIFIRGQAVQGSPPFHRPVNTVFQDYALFPHMTVLQNVMFGLRMEGVSRKESEKRALEALELVQLRDLSKRRPAQLSGGQKQRIALARALVKRPAVLLLDEPLAALDLKLRKQMQHELKTMQQEVGITFIFVTHDQEEAMTMADRIAVMHQGKVLQVGSGRDIYENPATRFVADFIGDTNFIHGTFEGMTGQFGNIRLDDQTVVTTYISDNFDSQLGDPVTLPLRPERIGIVERDDVADADVDNLTEVIGVVIASQYIGTDTRYTVRIAGNNEIIVRLQNMDYFKPIHFDIGTEVKVYWSLDSTTLLDE